MILTSGVVQYTFSVVVEGSIIVVFPFVGSKIGITYHITFRHIRYLNKQSIARCLGICAVHSLTGPRVRRYYTTTHQNPEGCVIPHILTKCAIVNT